MSKRRFAAAFLALAAVFALAPRSLAASAPKSPALALSGTSGAAVFGGALYVWGANESGQLGDGTRTTRLEPVLALTSVSSVASGGGHTLLLRADGTLWACGDNSYGQLGDGSRLTRLSPVKITDSVKFIAAGDDFSLAVKSNGTLWAWGNNDLGQLGDGSRQTRLEPVKILDSVASASGGDGHVLAVKTDGALWAWGSNDSGQLGDGTRTTRLEPVKILDSVASASAGVGSSLAVKTDGTLWTWGANTYGQLGDGSRDARLTPVKILSDVSSAVVAGTTVAFELAGLLRAGHALALKTDGTLWAWGYNIYGQLGDGTRTERLAPVQILSGVAEIAAGGNDSAAIKTDGTLHTWGGNDLGQLGTGDRTDRLTPVKILSGGAVKAVPTRQRVYVNGAQVAFDAYNIGGANYFKLRDLAMALTSTSKRFNATFDAANALVVVTPGAVYTPIGGELTPGSGAPAYITPVTHRIYIGGNQVTPDGYNLGGANYFKLREFMKILDVYVGYDAKTNSVTIDTSKGYSD
ncbi:MAG: hypothetical protein LBN99_01595 [Oscillospiraceae bacterium]|jgi:alpha-tubulin suppressor-like RCC1 family protein|nr:hypothetical protein [Oscillospiraceae bacterium]